jgi:hypothetical protein
MTPTPTPQSWMHFQMLAAGLRAHGVDCPMIFTPHGRSDFEVRFVGCVAESNPRHDNDNSPEAA